MAAQLQCQKMGGHKKRLSGVLLMSDVEHVLCGIININIYVCAYAPTGVRTIIIIYIIYYKAVDWTCPSCLALKLQFWGLIRLILE